MSDLETVIPVLEHLILFRHVLDDSTVKLWLAAGVSKDASAVASFYQLLGALLAGEEVAPSVPGCDLWQRHLLGVMFDTDNPLSYAASKGRQFSKLMKVGAEHDLAILEHAFQFDLRRLSARLEIDFRMPVSDDAGGETPAHPAMVWLASTRDWAAQATTLIKLMSMHGCGLFGKFTVLRYSEGKLHGVSYPDPIRLDDLIGYQSQRAVVVENTARFTAGAPAHNLLLYGDRGTGKSATVKAAAAQFAANGLRLIELGRHDLHALPVLLDQLRDQPYRFILFVDDLSFTEGDQELHNLKVLLEGTVQAVPANVKLYATSNRRHLVAEGAIDPQDETRPGDRIQERLALADRFGRTVVFSAPGQEEYLAIVESLAARAGLVMDKDTLRKRALAWTQWENSRTVRTANQFITELAGEQARSTLT